MRKAQHPPVSWDGLAGQVRLSLIAMIQMRQQSRTGGSRAALRGKYGAHYK
jgi:hypothetical protein